MTVVQMPKSCEKAKVDYNAANLAIVHLGRLQECVLQIAQNQSDHIVCSHIRSTSYVLDELEDELKHLHDQTRRELERHLPEDFL